MKMLVSFLLVFLCGAAAINTLVSAKAPSAATSTADMQVDGSVTNLKNGEGADPSSSFNKWDVDWSLIEQLQRQLQLLNQSHESASSMQRLNTFKDRRFTRKQLAKLAYRFSAYYQQYDPIDFCWIGDEKNSTEMLIADAIDYTAADSYSPRTLTRKQVSWRSQRESKKKRKQSEKRKASAKSSGLEQTGSEENRDEDQSDAGAAGDGAEEKDDEERNDKIHDFLLFVLLLPNHPYSQQMHQVIATVGPMFPSVTVVVGNAFEFRDMASKYFVTSYPKILFFKEGMFVGNFEGEYTLPAVTAQLTEWTALFPRSYPLHKSLHLTTAAMRHYTVNVSDVVHGVASVFNHAVSSFLNFSLDTHSLTSNWTLTDGSMFRFTVPAPMPNLEPFIGTVKRHALWDLVAFIASGTYVGARGVFVMWKYLQRR